MMFCGMEETAEMFALVTLSHKPMITPFNLWIPGCVVTFIAVCATRDDKVIFRQKVCEMI
jgi:hypothetical protein